ncbi:hypothetical protein LuPra_04677 [Luteitalea pratensis]|uniref:Plastocyanin n=1 Tax=Luteitalea pratensis TaxID=1855912 RepID=A0A143PRS5_LUTPR|nr:hypothetical protein [Luteitalea pratensis]AMY11427.1 hypothetical protein LuPra_04677 [Luteitalea pratensis]
MVVLGRWCLAVVVAGLGFGAACGGGSNPTTPSSPVGTGLTMTVDAGGVLWPKELVVTPGSRVIFVNQSSRARQVSSDPHPDHTDCPEINQVGFLGPGTNRETGNLNIVRTCGVHDHDDPDNANMRARIVVR